MNNRTSELKNSACSGQIAFDNPLQGSQNPILHNWDADSGVEDLAEGVIKKSVKEVLPQRLKCPVCEAKFNRKVLINKLEQFLEEKNKTFADLLDQVEEIEDLKEWNCPNSECRATIIPKIDRKNVREEIPNNGGGS